jgi:hypothetical protein
VWSNASFLLRLSQYQRHASSESWGLRNNLASILDGAAERNGRFAKNDVSILIEHRYFVMSLRQCFSAFVTPSKNKIRSIETV